MKDELENEEVPVDPRDFAPRPVTGWRLVVTSGGKCGWPVEGTLGFFPGRDDALEVGDYLSTLDAEWEVRPSLTGRL